MSNLEAVKQVISFDDDNFLNLTEKDITDLSFKRISTIKFDGIVISGLKKVDILNSNSLPIITACGCSMARSAEINKEENLIAIACENNNSLYIAHPKFESKMPISEKVTSVEKGLPDHFKEARIAGCKKYDLRQSLEIPWKPATYRITCFYYDWVSNTIETRLTDNKEESSTQELLPPPSRTDAMVNVKPHTGEADTALSFSLPASIPVNADRIMLKGSVDIGTNPRNRTKTAKNTLSVWKPLSLLLIEKNQGQKPVLQVDLTIAGAIPDNQSEIPLRLYGEFSIDLAQITGDYFSEKTDYCCYLVSYEKVAGPVFMKVGNKR